MKITTRLMLSAGGVGLIPFAPGTMASLVAAVFHYCMIFGTNNHIGIIASVVVMVIACVVTLALGSHAEGKDDENDDEKDPGWVVSDEVAGQLLASLWFTTPGLIAVSFVAFRFFDIAKVLGVNKLQKYHGGKGILVDDILAGVYAALVTLVVGLLAKKLGLPDEFFLRA